MPAPLEEEDDASEQRGPRLWAFTYIAAIAVACKTERAKSRTGNKASMGELGLTKIFAALLATAIVIMGLSSVSGSLFGVPAHHGHHDDEKSLNEKFAEQFAYVLPVAEGGSSDSGTDEPEEPSIDVLLAAADASAGSTVFRQQCAQCHSVDEGGANGTGPNLYAIVGGAKAAKDGFRYSGALTGLGGEWDYESLDAWLAAPAKFARGTSMSYAGLRYGDDRANVIAYLVDYSPNAPAFPTPDVVAETAAPSDEVTSPLDDVIEAVEDTLLPDDAVSEEPAN
ncbi:MAG: c-type cytochrome [Pseudomonadota bacterium]